MNEKLYCVMDDHDTPYENYLRTAEDDKVLLDLVLKHKLQLDRSSRLYKVAVEMNHPCLTVEVDGSCSEIPNN